MTHTEPSHTPSHSAHGITIGRPAGIEPVSFRKRVITGAIYAVVMLGCLLIGNRFFVLPALCVVMAAIGTFEFIRICQPDMNQTPRIIGLVMAMSLPLITTVARIQIPELPILKTGGLIALSALFFAVLAGMLCYLTWLAVTPTARARDAALSFFGALYLGMPLSCLILIRAMDTGLVLAVTTVVSIWVADSFAYIGGSLLGRHKLAPVISPKKSWEGLLFSLAGAIIIWYLAPLIINGRASIPVALTGGIIVAFSSLIGDLFESRIKREAGVKDSGKLLPGHGGILDRIDSLLFTSVFIYMLVSIVGTALGIVSP
ncbi:MAG: phosphatidate cytidylyltransferase [Actinomycetes bacterium]|nr:phosphatidate cytidylyltransferase [Actinomycetes bacterium]